MGTGGATDWEGNAAAEGRETREEKGSREDEEEEDGGRTDEGWGDGCDATPEDITISLTRGNFRQIHKSKKRKTFRINPDKR